MGYTFPRGVGHGFENVVSAKCKCSGFRRTRSQDFTMGGEQKLRGCNFFLKKVYNLFFNRRPRFQTH